MGRAAASARDRAVRPRFLSFKLGCPSNCRCTDAELKEGCVAVIPCEGNEGSVNRDDGESSMGSDGSVGNEGSEGEESILGGEWDETSEGREDGGGRVEVGHSEGHGR